MMKMITTSASKNLAIIVGAESLRDIFLRKTGNQYFSSRSGGFPVLEQVSKGVVRQKTQQECKMN